jgi:hypothetical protein
MWGYMGIWCSPNTLKSPQILFPKNTLPWWRFFYLAKNTLEWRGFVGISRDYPLKTRTSKQPIREIPGFEIIPYHPLKYPRSKQGLKEQLFGLMERGSTFEHIHKGCRLLCVTGSTFVKPTSCRWVGELAQIRLTTSLSALYTFANRWTLPLTDKVK